jgi:hypothetical protein
MTAETSRARIRRFGVGVSTSKYKEASQTRPSVAFALSGQAPWSRAARSGSLDKLGTGSSAGKKRPPQDDKQMSYRDCSESEARSAGYPGKL